MKRNNLWATPATLVVVMLILNLSSCSDSQPPYECAAQNLSRYQVRFYKTPGTSPCQSDAGFVMNDLIGGTASMETYKSITPNGNSGGLDVVFDDTTDKLDLSATKLGLRIDTLLSVANYAACDNDLNKDGGEDDVTREAEPKSTPDFFTMLPRFGTNGICASLPDSGTVYANVVFPEYTCQDMTVIPKVTISASMSNFKILSSARILSNLAKANISFNETNGNGVKCTTDYKVVIMAPLVQCGTNLDCSPDPIPSAPKCGKSPVITDYCLTLAGATTIKGSGITPNLIRRYSDGGYDLSGTCDPDLNVCIWDADAGI